MNRISLNEFVHFAELAKKKYPNAKMLSIGSGYANDKWHYTLFFEVNGKEIRYEIPMYKEEN